MLYHTVTPETVSLSAADLDDGLLRRYPRHGGRRALGSQTADSNWKTPGEDFL